MFVCLACTLLARSCVLWVYLVAAGLLQAAHQLLHCSMYQVVLLEVLFHRGEVRAPFGPLQQILIKKFKANVDVKVKCIYTVPGFIRRWTCQISLKA